MAINWFPPKYKENTRGEMLLVKKKIIIIKWTTLLKKNLSKLKILDNKSLATSFSLWVENNNFLADECFEPQSFYEEVDVSEPPSCHQMWWMCKQGWMACCDNGSSSFLNSLSYSETQTALRSFNELLLNLHSSSCVCALVYSCMSSFSISSAGVDSSCRINPGTVPKVLSFIF